MTAALSVLALALFAAGLNRCRHCHRDSSHWACIAAWLHCAFAAALLSAVFEPPIRPAAAWLLIAWGAVETLSARGSARAR